MRFVTIDLETANPDMSSICQIGVVRFEDGVEVAAEAQYVDPRDYFDPFNVSIHGIEEEHVRGAPCFADLHGWLHDWTAGRTVICHTHFDRTALAQACDRHQVTSLSCQWLDSARVARRAWSQFADKGYGLSNLASHFNIQFQHHDALHDARTAGLLVLRAIQDTGIDIDSWHARVRAPINRAEPTHRVGDGDGSLHGQVVVFTGALQVERRVAADMAAKAGGDVHDGVTKKTTVLVVGDQDIRQLAGCEKSNKHRKAEALMATGQRIRVIGETDFFALAAIAE